MGSVQRGTSVDTQNFCGLLELLLAVISVIHVLVIVFVFILVAAPGRSVSLPLLGLAATSSPAIERPLLAGLSSASLLASRSENSMTSQSALAFLRWRRRTPSPPS